jgi:hypothetical protein
MDALSGAYTTLGMLALLGAVLSAGWVHRAARGVRKRWRRARVLGMYPGMRHRVTTQSLD